MQPQLTPPEAKQSLIAQIAAEAARQSVALDDVEHRMLFFTEKAWMPEDTWQASEIFDKQYSQAEYEAKISALIASIHKTPQWRQAVQVLRTEDHYLLVMIDAASNSGHPWKRPLRDLLKLIATAIAVITIMLALVFAYHFVTDK